MQEARSQIDSYLQDALDLANKALDQEADEDEYVMAGESRLLGNATAEEMLKLRELFDAFEQKKGPAAPAGALHPGRGCADLYRRGGRLRGIWRLQRGHRPL